MFCQIIYLVVIGNPPYGVSIKGDFRKKVEQNLGKVPDYEIYYLFIEIAYKIASTDGIMSYIIPNTFLFNTFAEKYRITILRKWNVIEILDCTKFPIFESATVLNTINTWQKGNSEYIGYRNTADVNSFVDLITKPRLQISKVELRAMNQNWGLAFCLSKDIIKVIQNIKKAQANLVSSFEVSQGYIPYRKSDLIANFGKMEGEKIVNERLWHSKEKLGDTYIQEIFGRDITKYNYRITGDYVKYGKHLACYVDLKFFNSCRLLVREITNPTIISCLVSETLVNDPQLISIIPLDKSDFASLKVLWSILNSKLATFFHFNHAPKATKGAFPKILVKDIKEFPIPSISDNQKDTLMGLAEEILDSKKSNSQADTSVLEEEIDRMVYELYGLTETEIAIIENS